jgi:uncharacterized membrane protein
MNSPQQEQKKSTGFFAWLRTNFFTGLLVIAPILITFYIIKFTVSLVDNAVTSLFPSKYAPSNYLPYDIPGIELIFGTLALILFGILIRNYVGVKLLSWGEHVLHSIPGVRNIYGAVKQIIETLSTSNSSSFREVVLIEYPRKGVWVVAFVTGRTEGEIQRLHEDELVNIFVPTTPNPTSGFLLFLPRRELTPLQMSVEQGVKLVISAGIITPSTAEGKAALAIEKKVSKDTGTDSAKLTEKLDKPKTAKKKSAVAKKK